MLSRSWRLIHPFFAFLVIVHSELGTKPGRRRMALCIERITNKPLLAGGKIDAYLDNLF
jgi:hypothetical protein